MKSSNDDNKYVISAGLVAFGISFSVLLTWDYLFPPDIGGNLIISIFSGFLVYVIASAFAGFLITYKSPKEQIITSLKASFFGFMINALIMLFLGTVYGLVWIFMGYITGGMIGGILGKIFAEKQKEGESDARLTSINSDKLFTT